MFPPKRPGPAGAPPPRNMRDIRRDVGTTQPEPPPVEEPKGSTATVSTQCPECGCKYDMNFTADEPEPAGAEVPVGGEPLNTSGGGPV